MGRNISIVGAICLRFFFQSTSLDIYDWSTYGVEGGTASLLSSSPSIVPDRRNSEQVELCTPFPRAAPVTKGRASAWSTRILPHGRNRPEKVKEIFPGFSWSSMSSNNVSHGYLTFNFGGLA
jgi:hypothetical protein